MVERTTKVSNITLNSIPDKYKCSKIISDLLLDLPDLLNIGTPTNANLGYAAASQNAPDAGQAILWISLDGTGVPLAINYYIDGAWREILNLKRTPQWFEGNYLQLRDQLEKKGFVLADGKSGGPNLSHQFLRIGTTPVNYSVWAMYFTGQQLIRSVNTD